MLTALRGFAKSWVAVLLILLLAASFAIFGMNDVFRMNFGGTVIDAGKREISPADFKQVFDSNKTRLEQRFNQPIPLEMAVERGLDRQLLQDMAQQVSLSVLMEKIGIRPSDNLVAKQIALIPAFFDQVSGRFDKAAYQARLQENGLTVPRFEQDVRDQIAAEHLQAALFEGFASPKAYGALAAIFALETHDLSYITVQPQNLPPVAAPTDAQLQAFMNENAAQLTRPETRVLTVVRFDPNLAASDLKIDPADLQKRYEFRKDTLSAPETRSLVQIPARTAQAAEGLAAQLRAGADPAAVAKAAKVDAITYADKPQTAIADRKAAAAVFATPAGDVRVIQGDLGFSAVKVLKVTPGHQATLEELRPQLEAELRKDAAAEKIYALSQAYEDAHQKGASLAEAAQKAGVAAVTIGPVTKDGRDDRGGAVSGLTRKVLDTAFALPAGGESDVTAEEEGRYFAVRVERVTPPALPPLAEVKTDLARVWMQRETMKRMQAKADELAARVQKGESLQAVGASLGLATTRLAGLDRRTAEQHQNLSPDFVTKAMESKAGEVFTGAVAPFGVAVAKVDTTRPGDPTQLAQATAITTSQMTQTAVEELAAALRSAALASVKPKIHPDAARAALGLAPANEKAAGTAKKTP